MNVHQPLLSDEQKPTVEELLVRARQVFERWDLREYADLYIKQLAQNEKHLKSFLKLAEGDLYPCVAFVEARKR